jgi:hypothetical protein
MGFMDDYEGVADRIKRFWVNYPMGRIETEIVEFSAQHGFILVKALAYRDNEDLKPAATDFAYGYKAAFNPNMARWFVEDTTTSAIGRVIGLLLGTDKRPTKENMAQVENTSAVVANDNTDPWATNAGDFPSFKTQEELEAAEAKQTTNPIAPHCDHGLRKWVQGEKNGKAWGGFMCQESDKRNQCAPQWYSMGSTGKWAAQL